MIFKSILLSREKLVSFEAGLGSKSSRDVSQDSLMGHDKEIIQQKT